MRLVPMRQGVHLPQDSSTVNSQEELGDIHHAVVLVHDDHAAGAHHGADGDQVVVVDREYRSWQAGMQPPEGPPVCAALNFLPFGTPPPMSSMISRSVVPIGISTRPVLLILPPSANTLVPLDLLGAHGGEPFRAVVG